MNREQKIRELAEVVSILISVVRFTAPSNCKEALNHLDETIEEILQY